MSIREHITWRDIDGIRVGRFGGRVNTTSILWRLGSTIIDTGPPNQWASVRRFVEERPVERVVVTHHHEDHAGNLARFRALGHEDLLAPRESLAFLERGFPLQAYRRVVWGVPGRTAARPFSGEIELPDGGRLVALLLPGHSPDMTCLLDPERGALFGADVYVGSHLRYLRRDENLNGIIAALGRLLEIDFDVLLCSHRGIVEPPRPKLRQKLESLLELREQARTLAGRGHSIAEITRRLLGPEDFITRVSFGHFSKQNLVLACLDPEGNVTAPSSAPRGVG